MFIRCNEIIKTQYLAAHIQCICFERIVRVGRTAIVLLWPLMTGVTVINGMNVQVCRNYH